MRIITKDEMAAALETVVARDPNRTNEGDCVYVYYKDPRGGTVVTQDSVIEIAEEIGIQPKFDPIPHCIIGVALAELGVPLDILAALGQGDDIQTASVALESLGVELEDEALRLAINVQQMADDGGDGFMPWSDVLD